jgi:DNA invertase Pin-like site-specific DNA recombinase
MSFGERHGQAKLTEDQVLRIRELAKAGTYTQRRIAEMFGVSQATVAHIKFGRWWKHLWKDAPQGTANAAGVTANME